MEPAFWHQKWERGEIGFHGDEVNTLLASHFSTLNLPEGARVLLPLCGKTLDIPWLLSQGYQVVGVELSQLAIDALFESLGVEPRIVEEGSLQRYSADNIDILVGGDSYYGAGRSRMSLAAVPFQFHAG